MLVVFEGLDNTGKTTHAHSLTQALQELFGDDKVMYLKEPGGSLLSLKIRELIAEDPFMPPDAQGHLYTAGMLYTDAKVIKPALRDGKIVIIDRYVQSTYAYQVYVGGMRSLIPCVENLSKPDVCLYTYSESGNTVQRDTDEDMDKVGEVFAKYKEALDKVYNHMFVKPLGTMNYIPTYVDHNLRRLNVDNTFAENHTKAREFVVEVALRDFGMRVSRSYNG